MQPLKLRPARSVDLPEILRIQALCYQAIEPEDAAAYAHKLALAPDCAFVMADATQTVRAYLFALPIALDQPPALNASDFALAADANCLYLHDMAIDPTARGQGLSTPLMTAFFAAASARQLAWCSLIAIQNSSAFWQRYGFAQHALSHSPAMLSKLASYGQAKYLLQARPEQALSSLA